jgi:DNA-directed RNA polymerase subunit RPC12/RpoP
MRDKLLTEEYYDLPAVWNRKQKFRARQRLGQAWNEKDDRLPVWETGFRCAHCWQPVSSNPHRSGVNHRNHCPYCLWSRHLDLREAGDRLAACKAKMEPVGIAAKLLRKKYGQLLGELMLVHRCMDCGRVSLNRLAADDDPEMVLAVFSASTELRASCRRHLLENGIMLLTAADSALVYRRLFGMNALQDGNLKIVDV